MDIETLMRSGLNRKLIHAEKCRRSLYLLVRTFWHVVEPGSPFFPGWHIQALAEHLEAVTYLTIRKLLVMCPPRHSKSSLVGVYWPLWEWLQDPAVTGWAGAHTKWMFMSYSATLSHRDAEAMRTIMNHPLFQEMFDLRLDDKRNTVGWYKNLQGGQRISSSIEGMSTGEGGHRIIVDDPHQAREINYPTVRKGVITWWREAMSTRENDPKTTCRVVNMQPLHRDDLSQYLQKEERGWEVFKLPIRFFPATPCVTKLGLVDRRTEPKELLWSNRYMKNAQDAAGSIVYDEKQQRDVVVTENFRYDDEWEQDLRINLGAAASAQLDMDPKSAEDGFFKEEYFPFYDTLPVGDLFWLWSWDMSFKNIPTADNVAGVLIAYYPPMRRFYVTDRIMGRMAYKEAKPRIVTAWEDSPFVHTVLVEDTANGPAILSDLGDSNIPLVPWSIGNTPKTSRQQAVASKAKQQRIWLPRWASWVFEPRTGMLQEFCDLPNADHDDQSDAVGNAVLYVDELHSKGKLLTKVNIGIY